MEGSGEVGLVMEGSGEVGLVMEGSGEVGLAMEGSGEVGLVRKGVERTHYATQNINYATAELRQMIEIPHTTHIHTHTHAHTHTCTHRHTHTHTHTHSHTQMVTIDIIDNCCSGQRWTYGHKLFISISR